MRFIAGVGPLRFSAGCIAYNNINFFPLYGACWEVVFEFEWRAAFFGSSRATHSTSQHAPKTYQTRKGYMQNNLLLIKNPFEWKDNSNT